MTINEAKLVRLFHGNSKSLYLGGYKLKEVPAQLSQLQNLLSLELQNNNLHTLPESLSSLDKLEVLNLGNNNFYEMPLVVEYLINLTKLHLYKNCLKKINGAVFHSLKRLTTLNLNNNQLSELPPEIRSLVSLEVLSLDGNKLTELPPEICWLPCLRELRACNNNLQYLPLEIGLSAQLTKLYLSQNKIKELPEGFGNLKRLNVLDVAGNELRIFPTEVSFFSSDDVTSDAKSQKRLNLMFEFAHGQVGSSYRAFNVKKTHNMPLRELYCESNPLLEEVAVHSVQEEEILSLKELSARLVMKEVRDKASPVRRMIVYFPGVREMLSQASRCAVCSEAFLNTWLECVKFVKSKQDLSIRKCPSPLIPIRALLCSYKCFNSEGHGFYGVAFP